MHKSLVCVGICAVAFGAPLFATGVAHAQAQPAAEKNWSATLDTEVRFYSFESNRGSPPLTGLGTRGKSTGDQWNTPFGVKIEGKPADNFKIELLARSGYIWSKHKTTAANGDAFSGEHEGMTDTTVGGTFTYMGFTGFQPFYAVNTNIPTGKSSLKGNASAARLDQDVAGPPTFGEGSNWGHTVGLNMPLNKQTNISIGAGYTQRGKLEWEGSVQGSDGSVPTSSRVDPGDVYTYNAQFGWQGEQTAIQGQVSYSYETKTLVDNFEYYRSGDKIQIGLGLQHSWTPELITRVTGSWTKSEKNDVRKLAFGGFLAPTLVEEDHNSNSRVFQASIDQYFRVGSFYVGPTVGYMYRDHNDWEPTRSAFLPAKVKWSAGGVLQGNVSNSLSVTARVERVWLTELEKPNWNSELIGVPATGGYPETKTDVWQATVGGSIKF